MTWLIAYHLLLHVGKLIFICKGKGQSVHFSFSQQQGHVLWLVLLYLDTEVKQSKSQAKQSDTACWKTLQWKLVCRYKNWWVCFSGEIFFFSDRLLSVLHGHSVFSSPSQRRMSSDFEGFLSQILSITLLFQEMFSIPNLNSDLSTHLSLSIDPGPNESMTESNCDLFNNTDMAQLSLEIEKQR